MQHRLPVHDTDLAAALRVAGGFTLEPKTYRDADAGTEETTWFITSGVPQAATWLEQHRSGEMDPAHPVMSALGGIRALKDLLTWVERPWERPAGVAGTLVIDPAETARVPLLPVAEMQRIERAEVLEALRSKKPLPLMPHHFAAAARVAGCEWRAMEQGGSGPVLVLSSRSVRHPAVTIDLLRAAASGDIGAPLVIGDAEPGEHPFFYALEACRTWGGYHVVESLTRANVTHLFKAKHGPHTAVISDSLLRGPRKDKVARLLKQHLTTVPA